MYKNIPLRIQQGIPDISINWYQHCTQEAYFPCKDLQSLQSRTRGFSDAFFIISSFSVALHIKWA